ncbi:MAG: hypothetical protein AVDCRST_MAG17-2235, partial [uncultured Solirubrobacterales bacterium]
GAMERVAGRRDARSARAPVPGELRPRRGRRPRRARPRLPLGGDRPRDGAHRPRGHPAARRGRRGAPRRARERASCPCLPGPPLGLVERRPGDHLSPSRGPRGPARGRASGRPPRRRFAPRLGCPAGRGRPRTARGLSHARGRGDRRARSSRCSRSPRSSCGRGERPPSSRPPLPSPRGSRPPSGGSCSAARLRL